MLSGAGEQGGAGTVICGIFDCFGGLNCLIVNLSGSLGVKFRSGIEHTGDSFTSAGEVTSASVAASLKHRVIWRLRRTFYSFPAPAGMGLCGILLGNFVWQIMYLR